MRRSADLPADEPRRPCLNAVSIGPLPGARGVEHVLGRNGDERFATPALPEDGPEQTGCMTLSGAERACAPSEIRDRAAFPS
jgi:hypothetical protein